MPLKRELAGYIYIIQFETGCKIGLTRNMKRRLDTYKNPWCRPILDYQVYVCDRPEIAEFKILEFYKERLLKKNCEFIINKQFKLIKQTALRIINEVNECL